MASFYYTIPRPKQPGSVVLLTLISVLRKQQVNWAEHLSKTLKKDENFQDRRCILRMSSLNPNYLKASSSVLAYVMKEPSYINNYMQFNFWLNLLVHTVKLHYIVLYPFHFYCKNIHKDFYWGIYYWAVWWGWDGEAGVYSCYKNIITGSYLSFGKDYETAMAARHQRQLLSVQIDTIGFLPYIGSLALPMPPPLFLKNEACHMLQKALTTKAPSLNINVKLK